MKTVIYFKRINDIGGVESWLYYLSKKYKFTFYYKEGDPNQIKRLAENIAVKKYKGEKIVCDRFLVNYNPDIIDNVEAKEYIMMIHCDYSAVKFKPITHPKFTKYIGVSKYVCDVFTKLTGIEAEVIYNPIEIDKPKVKKKPGLQLISATRLSSEKGGWRIDKLSETLDKLGVQYTWTIYTDRTPNFRSPNVIIKKPKLDLSKEMAESTYLVQLSDAEAYCLSVVESLTLGTPVIVTDLPVYNELGIDETNSIKLDFYLTNLDVNKIVKKLPEFKYKPPKSNWGKYLDNEMEYNPNEIVKVKAIKRKLWLVEEDLHLEKNDIIELPLVRACELEAKEYVEICN